MGIPEASWHSLWCYRMTGSEGTLAAIQDDIKAGEFMCLAQGHTQPRLDHIYPILSLLNEKKEVKRAVTIPRQIERVFRTPC